MEYHFVAVENTNRSLPKTWRTKFLEVEILIGLISIYLVWQIQEFYAKIRSYLNLVWDKADLFCWYHRNKWFLLVMVAELALESDEDKGGLTWYFLWGIYTSVPTRIHWQNSGTVQVVDNWVIVKNEFLILKKMFFYCC